MSVTGLRVEQDDAGSAIDEPTAVNVANAPLGHGVERPLEVFILGLELLDFYRSLSKNIAI
jgi:hypothetical protein